MSNRAIASRTTGVEVLLLHRSLVRSLARTHWPDVRMHETSQRQIALHAFTDIGQLLEIKTREQPNHQTEVVV